MHDIIHKTVMPLLQCLQMSLEQFTL